MKIPVSFCTLHAMADKNILVDSGATDHFIHPKLVKRLGLGVQRLEKPRKIWNIDGTNNKGGELTNFIDLEVRTVATHYSLVVNPTVTRTTGMTGDNRGRLMKSRGNRGSQATITGRGGDLFGG